MAALVILYHAGPIADFADANGAFSSWMSSGANWGTIAVAGFFAISGFLVTKSWAADPSPRRFTARRILRIFPGVWICLLVVAFVIGPIIYAQEPHAASFWSGQTAAAGHFVWHNAFLPPDIRFGFGNVGEALPFPGGTQAVLVGSLWTLPYELACYVALVAIGLFASFAARRFGALQALSALLILGAVGSWVMMIAAEGGAHIGIPYFGAEFLGRFGVSFTLGGLAALHADRVPMDRRVAAGAGAIWIVTLLVGGWPELGLPVQTYLILWLAYRLPLRGWDRPGDFSYGMYIYGFPLQQALVALGVQTAGVIPYIATALVAATLAGAASWWLVERWALLLKPAQVRLPLPVPAERPPPGLPAD